MDKGMDGSAGALTYYNEWDGFAAQWLRNLMAAGQISEGVVDERSITELEPGDIPGRAHFFAGIGGWELALQLSGWPADRPVWTGSCPCQPFSAANQDGTGMDDERHLWPAMFNLIRERRPPTVFGEQVADAIKDGWLDRVFDDLEGAGYACGAAVLPACSVGAPHLRKRIFWVADAEAAEVRTRLSEVHAGSLAQKAHGLGDRGLVDPWADWEPVVRFDPGGTVRARVEHGTKPMAPRLPNHVGLARAYGNAIVPQVAAEFIRAFLETSAASAVNPLRVNRQDPPVTSKLPAEEKGKT